MDHSDKVSTQGDFVMPTSVLSVANSAPTTHNFKNIIVLPAAHGGSFGQYISVYWGQEAVTATDPNVIKKVFASIKNVTSVVYHNSDWIETGATVGEVGPGESTASLGYHVDEITEFKNNLHWTPNGMTPGYFMVRKVSQLQDMVRSVNIDYNWGHQLWNGTGQYMEQGGFRSFAPCTLR